MCTVVFEQEILGRLLAMLFQWFDATAYLPDGSWQTKIIEGIC